MPEEHESTKGIEKPATTPPPPAAGEEKPGQRCLLTIAINKYDNREGTRYGELKYPVSNAEELSKELVKSYGFSKVVSICDGQCTKEKIEDAILEARDHAGKTGQLVVFFTGHGVAEGIEGYWVPHDARLKTEKNYGVFAVLNSVMGKCAQVLMVVDCCFSGAASSAAYSMALFKQQEIQNSVFSIITAGNMHEAVPDNSVFFETLINILRYDNIKSFSSLVTQLDEQLKHRKCATTVTRHSTVDQLNQEFILQRQDKVSFQLAQSFMNLNYTDQSRELAGAALFNLTYLRGSSDCGHQVFLQRYFNAVAKGNPALSSNPMRKIFFGGANGSAQYNFWDQMASQLGLGKAEPAVIIKAMLNVLTYSNFCLIAWIKPICDETAMENAIKDFWKEIFKYASANKKEMREYTNRVYFFIWDIRGNTGNVCDIVTEDKFKELLNSLHAKLLPLPAVTYVKDKDLINWYNAASTFEELNNDEKFQCLEPTNLDEPRSVMNVIAQIEERCEKKNAFDNYFPNINY